jgi:DnaK suppressor protein
MPEELSGAERSQLRAALEALREDLARQLEGLAAGVKPVDLEEPIGRLSRMDAMQQQKMAEASRRAARQRYDRVIAAMAAWDRGEYGDCLRCEEPIGYKRLSARPETALCLSCQAAKEKQR